MNVVRRIALVLALVGTLALASVAWAGTFPFVGKFESGGTVSFDFSGPPTESEDATIQNWAWTRLRIKCSNGWHRYSGSFDATPAVVDTERRFHVEQVRTDGGGRAILDGRFKRDWQRAKGTFKVKGRTSVGRRCRSGKVEWKAHEAAQPAS
jgi:hypothetical protein